MVNIIVDNVFIVHDQVKNCKKVATFLILCCCLKMRSSNYKGQQYMNCHQQHWCPPLPASFAAACASITITWRLHSCMLVANFNDVLIVSFDNVAVFLQLLLAGHCYCCLLLLLPSPSPLWPVDYWLIFIVLKVALLSPCLCQCGCHCSCCCHFWCLLCHNVSTATVVIISASLTIIIVWLLLCCLVQVGVLVCYCSHCALANTVATALAVAINPLLVTVL